MTVVADFSVPAGEFVLGRLLEVRPGVRVRLESMIPAEEAVIPYVWVRSPDDERVLSALDDAELVESVRVVDRIDDETLFRIDWAVGVDGLIEAIGAADGVILNGEGHGDRWTFQLRFPTYDALSAFYRDVIDRDISVDLGGIHDPVETGRGAGFALTAQQVEALSLALESGYFAVPREITLVGLADELGISDSAVSQRIRRGLAKLVSATLPAESTDE